ncbi:MAG: long-chain-fatty-acid--CoA ligase [Deltaproteobacteria bacterium]|nr:long-chain-fatty-acid--CoA ligase [Deltaproteobacteria bacterium]
MYALSDISRKGAIRFPNREAIVFEKTRLTYKTLNERVNQFANALTERGYQKGDRFAVLSENTHKYLEIYFAASKLGMSVTPLNSRLSVAETEYIVNDSEAVCFLAGDGFENLALAMKDNLSDIRDWVTLDNEKEGFLYYENLIRDASRNELAIPIDEDDMAVLMYTGGTTGLPKGVMMSHRNLMTSFINSAITMKFTPDDSTAFVLPLFHVSFWSAMAMLLVGGKVVIIRKPDLSEILISISKEKCTHINAVPTIYGWLLQMPDIEKYDLSSLRSIGYAGSPMPREMLKKCILKFGNIFEQAYGSTEALGVTHLQADDHELEGKRSKLLLSAGKEMLCGDVCVVDENDASLKPGEIGEVVVCGKHVMMGYWKNPELTAKTIRNGWHHMGDMGYLDEDGYLFLVDRKADMIVTGGENVYPKETEDVLYEHPAVMECAVVSAPDKKWGERVQAVVVLKSGMSVSEEALIAHCKESLAGYKCPKKIELWEELPKTAVGKILRKDVRATFWKGKDRSIG